MQKIRADEDNIRLDKYIKENSDLSREKIIKQIKNKTILVNNKASKPSYIVRINDEITINEEEKATSNFKASDIKIDIVYEDDYLIVVNKQSGLTVHPGAGNSDHTLVNALLYYGKNLSAIGGLERPGVVHRIDKDTSGLIILAKDDKTHELLSDYFKEKKINREYIALVKGVIKENTGVVDAPIGRNPHNRLKMCVIKDNSKKAVTNFKVLKRYSKYTLLSLVLETGRTHQIRVHMDYIGHPVYNDPIYTNDKVTEFGQFLHSYKMDFIHPITNEKMSFTAPLPKEFQDFIDELDKENN